MGNATEQKSYPILGLLVGLVTVIFSAVTINKDPSTFNFFGIFAGLWLCFISVNYWYKKRKNPPPNKSVE